LALFGSTEANDEIYLAIFKKLDFDFKNHQFLILRIAGCFHP